MKSDFATRLKHLRVLRGLRQKDLANALGLAQTTIANYEQKLRFPDEPTLVRIADYFSVSLDHLLGRDDGSAPDPGPAALDAESPSDLLQGIAMEYFRRLREQGRGAARERLLQAMAEGTSLHELYLRVFAPALREVGRLWARGELSVGEEHAFSEATQQLMAELAAPALAATASGAGPRCVVLAVGGEQHVIGARMVADFLSMAGCQVRFLGGNLSIGHALEVLRGSPPDLLCLSLTLREHMNAARDLIAAVRSHKDLAGMKIMVGGQAFSAHPHEEASLGADAAAGDAEDAVGVALRLASKER